jgi:DNA-binding NtrC family response regulator
MKKAEKNKGRVLVVDDEVDFASTLAERLQMRGYDANAVHCAEDAFEAIKQSLPDVMLVDLIMPGTGGIEVLTTVKRSFPDVSVILLTGHVDIGKEIGNLKHDVSYIIKPVDISVLTAMIDKARMDMTNRRRQPEP